MEEGQTDRQTRKASTSRVHYLPGEVGAVPHPSMSDHSYSDRLHQDTAYLRNNRNLTERIVDKLVLQLNRVYPQVLSNKEAEKFRNLKTPLRTRLSDLLKHLQRTGERECQEFYRALQNNADQVYATLPSRNNLSTSDPLEISPVQEKMILNEHGPVFFLACFSVAAGLAFLMYYNNPEVKSPSSARKVFGFSAIGFGRHIRNILISFLEDTALN
ncbi:caspase recruitment domain-containing protein 19 isoform X1 [Bufo bufo]|uniref:caspase recruitment domain-containing protein 19 isoform X1 n=1 Tax=Bufo bufo TaxID=8384 RepID=UPI001ABE7FD6|nr:caspase recruitment domain-containing protein 19 isoform X1 [Bufo bufo]